MKNCPQGPLKAVDLAGHPMQSCGNLVSKHGHLWQPFVWLAPLAILWSKHATNGSAVARHLYLYPSRCRRPAIFLNFLIQFAKLILEIELKLGWILLCLCSLVTHKRERARASADKGVRS